MKPAQRWIPEPDDDVTLGDPYLAGVKRSVGRLTAACAVITAVALVALAIWVFVSLGSALAPQAPYSPAPTVTGGIGSALSTTVPE
jgi:hypothetical protein